MKENFTALRQVNDPPIAVEIDNPKTIGFEVCRTNLLTGSVPPHTPPARLLLAGEAANCPAVHPLYLRLLKTVASSGKAVPLPLKLFEVLRPCQYPGGLIHHLIRQQPPH